MLKYIKERGLTMSTYTDEFKKQIVSLYNNKKPANEIVKEYKILRSALYKEDRWVTQFNNTQSFKAKDNRTKEEVELIKLRKELAQLKMENDILKQASLIMARK